MIRDGFETTEDTESTEPPPRRRKHEGTKDHEGMQQLNNDDATTDK